MIRGMDWISLAAVITTGVVAVATFAFNWLMRRGDHKHTSALEFEKRIWETKSAALLNLIGVCQSVLDAIAADPDREQSHKQYEAFRVFAKADYRIEAPEIIAYASEQVREAVSDLQKVASSVERKHDEMDAVIGLYNFAPEYFGFDEDDPLFEFHPEYLRQVEELTRKLGETSGIDLDNVCDLCARIIGHARTDLRGK